LDLEKYHKAISCIEKGENLQQSIAFLNELKEKEPSLDENCEGWIRKAYKKLRIEKDKELLKVLRETGGVIIRKKYAKNDLLLHIKHNYHKICPGQIVYENYSDEYVRGSIDFVIKKENGRFTFINVYPFTGHAAFIGGYLGAAKALERKLDIEYPIYYIAPRYTRQAVSALSHLEIIHPIWFEYDKQKGRLTFHFTLNSQPEMFSANKYILSS